MYSGNLSISWRYLTECQNIQFLVLDPLIARCSTDRPTVQITVLWNLSGVRFLCGFLIKTADGPQVEHFEFPCRISRERQYWRCKSQEKKKEDRGGAVTRWRRKHVDACCGWAAVTASMPAWGWESRPSTVSGLLGAWWNQVLWKAGAECHEEQELERGPQSERGAFSLLCTPFPTAFAEDGCITRGFALSHPAAVWETVPGGETRGRPQWKGQWPLIPLPYKGASE